MADTPINFITIRFIFEGPAPQNVLDLGTPELDVNDFGFGRTSTQVRWINRLESKFDTEIQSYWDEGIAALVERLGGLESFSKVAVQTKPSIRNLFLRRESVAPDIIDTHGGFTVSDHYSLSLSSNTMALISKLGLGLCMTYRVVPEL